MKHLRGIAGVTFAFIASVAHSQWTVTNLHPMGATYSYGYGVARNLQVGRVGMPSGRASIWYGTANSWVDLSPAGATETAAYGTDGIRQVGTARIGGTRYDACYWSGSANSYTDLRPGNSGGSFAYGVSGSNIAGFAIFPGTFDHAIYWPEQISQWVDLTAGRMSEAYGASSNSQVGWSEVGQQTQQRASLWYGTAASRIDLHPDGMRSSRAYCCDGPQQAGFVEDTSRNWRAALWNGFATPWVDLTPSGSEAAEVRGIHSGFQVGRVYLGNRWVASFWNGTASSWENLATDLPGSWGETNARGVWSDGTTIQVVGYGFNNDTNRFEALLWTRQLNSPETVFPTGFVTIRGRLDAGDVSSLGADDNNYLRHCKFIVPNQVVPPIEVQVNGTTTKPSTTGVAISLTGAMSVSGIFTHSVEQWNWVTGAYEDASTLNATTSETTVSSLSTGVHDQKIGAGGALRARYFVRQTGPSASLQFCYNADLVKWVVN